MCLTRRASLNPTVDLTSMETVKPITHDCQDESINSVSPLTKSTISDRSESVGSVVVRRDIRKIKTPIKTPKLVQNRDPSHIRDRYLSRLGFGIPQPNHSKHAESEKSRQPLHCRPVPFTYQECLNDEDDIMHYESPRTIMNDIYTTRSSPRSPRNSKTAPTANFTSKARKQSVRFGNSVSVRLIPNKDMYSQRIRKFLWNNPHELAENAERNCIEFASENWDWQQACDDEHFFTCPNTGDKIHPVHVHWLDYIMGNSTRSSRQHSFLDKSREMASNSRSFRLYT
mmetsp:Transcript_19407/g.28314  ORF Transcript_19407/g.28314 Transcript_19407/m.28314 type:complete len:285 (-) Transcript_19407:36-890(-)